MSRPVTEKDFRHPKFRDKEVEDYEFRSDGEIARKDRWEMGINRIRALVGNHQRQFEIDDVVSAVDYVMHLIPDYMIDGDDEEENEQMFECPSCYNVNSFTKHDILICICGYRFTKGTE